MASEKSKVEDPIVNEVANTDEGLRAQAKKVEELHVLDIEAREVAAHDREKADALLTDMKNGRFTVHQDTQEALQLRAASAAEALKHEVGHTPETIDGYVNSSNRMVGGKGTPETIDKAAERLQKVTQELDVYHNESMQPVIESLAKEKNPIAHGDYQERTAGQKQNFLRAVFPWFAPVWFLPKAFFRSDKGRAAPHSWGK